MGIVLTRKFILPKIVLTPKFKRCTNIALF